MNEHERCQLLEDFDLAILFSIVHLVTSRHLMLLRVTSGYFSFHNRNHR